MNDLKKALFLDRDGIINEDTWYVHKIEEFRFMDGIFDFCRAAQAKGYMLIVVTNQAGIGRGYYTEDDFHKLNNWMIERFAEQGVTITKTYFCPCHATHGIGKYKVMSPNRKPQPGMFFQARDEWGIDLARSVLIGDKKSDIEAGHNAGVGKLIFKRGQYACVTDVPHVVCETFGEIIDII